MIPASSLAGPTPGRSTLFDETEPVLQSHALTEGIEVPRFGDLDVWDFAAHERPPNLTPAAWNAQFTDVDPVWNLRSRELVMIMLNPHHRAIAAAGHRTPAHRHCSIQYANMMARGMRFLAQWARETGLPPDLRAWDTDAPRAYIAKRGTETEPTGLVNDVLMVKKLHGFGDYFTHGGLAADPWPGQSARQVAKVVGRKPVTTPNIAPEMWFALIKAAYTYVSEFVPDILAARERYRGLIERAKPGMEGLEDALMRFAAAPDTRVPVHSRDRPGFTVVAKGTPSYKDLYLILGFHPDHVDVGSKSYLERWIRARIAPMLAADRVAPGVLRDYLREVTRPDGALGPWHPGLGTRDLSMEITALRNAVYILVAGLSMMRDSEIRAIRRGSVVEYHGSPAVISRKRKRDPDVPLEHWWICDQVAEAIAVGEALSWHDELIFTGVGKRGIGSALAEQPTSFSSSDAVKEFIRHVNSCTEDTGLSIPAGQATPQQFRKTMAMLTARRPGGEIATRHQLKHVAVRVMANRVTEGYWADDASWAKLLDTALEDVRIEKLSDLYHEYQASGTLGRGPAAEKLAGVFDAVAEQAAALRSTGAARHGDARVEFDLLRQARISIRFGTLNHCTVDDRNPAGAKCLETGLRLPPGHSGPVQNLCRPGKCANALIRPEHVAIRRLERVKLVELMANPKLSPPQRGALKLQLDEVDEVIAKVEG